MTRQNSINVGRKSTVPRQRWDKVIYDTSGSNYIAVDATPAPGGTYTRDTWPPRGRGRGESLTSPRRIQAKLRAVEVIRMRAKMHTWQQIARALGFKDASGAYRAYKRTVDRVDWDRDRRQQLQEEI